MNRANYSGLAAIAAAVLLTVRFLLAVSDLVAASVSLHAPNLYPVIGEPLDKLYPAHTPMMILAWLSIGVWLYQYHRDLGRLRGDYPITPKGALARAFIPVYHFWGFLNLWDTLHNYSFTFDMPKRHISVRSAAMVFYGTWVVIGIAGQMTAFRHWPWSNLITEFTEIASISLLVWVATSTLNGLSRSATVEV